MKSGGEAAHTVMRLRTPIRSPAPRRISSMRDPARPLRRIVRSAPWVRQLVRAVARATTSAHAASTSATGSHTARSPALGVAAFSTTPTTA